MDCRKIINYREGKLCELPEGERALVEAAFDACNRAYAPFSEFFVGAAALLEGGEVITATNQESEVYPSGMCAERVLMYTVKSLRPDAEILTVAIASKCGGVPLERHIFPCGACLQTLVDMEARQDGGIKVIMAGATECTIVERASDMMPFRFNLIKR